MVRNLGMSENNRFLLATIGLFLFLFGAGSVLYDGFLSVQVFLNLFIDNAYLIIVATGMAFVIITGGIDLSVASLVALVSVITAMLLSHGVHPALVMLLVLVFGAVFGFVQGYFICKFNIHSWIVTLAGMFFARGVSNLLSTESITIEQEQYVRLSNYKLSIFGAGYISIGVVISFIVVAIAIYLSRYSQFGRNVFALGGNEKSALLMGLPVEKTKIMVYTLSGICSALGGIVFTFYMLSGYALHLMGMEMDAIAACVIGGILLTGGYGNVIGPTLGVLSMGVIQTIIMFQGTLSSWWTKIVVGFLLFLFIVLQKLMSSRRKRNTTSNLQGSQELKPIEAPGVKL